MSQTTPLTGHAIFPSFTATATLQKRLGSDVVADPPPALTWLEIWNPVHWSKDDRPRFLALARELAQLIVLIYLYFFLKGNS